MTALDHYCTYFDHRYLTRGLALYASMRRHCRPFRLWALCMSEACYRALDALSLPDLVPLRREDLEHDDGELRDAQLDRTPLEYYFTCTAALMAWLLKTQPSIAALTYLDADLFFFDSPRRLFEEFADSSTLIVPHRFSKRNEGLKRWGEYNVGWVTFRRDADGLACLAWWRRSCIEWCHDRLEDERFADQKYLDQFPKRFRRVGVIDYPGANLAPWNLDNHRLTAGADGAPQVDGVPVTFVHFHGMRRVAPFLWRTSHPDYGAPLDRTVKRLLYQPYLIELARAGRLLDSRTVRSPLARGGAGRARRWRDAAAVLRRGGALWVVGGRVL
jgi:hypothetical protein